MAEGFQPEQTGSAQQQVEAEVTVTQVGRAIAGMFGGEYTHQSGGGGAGGHYEFTSLTELDEIITELKIVADGIIKDGRKLDDAQALVSPPANDVMSVLQANAAVVSIQAARDHNRRMSAAAEAEIAKLETARQAYAQVEGTSAQSFRMRG
ncbi:hypothetical protein JOF56_011399 [Kibdelosporangium banguiense]|uniref:PE family protein n=1 Tax=Kibdelosporangium banguiense TaxID=1365924 RepID=A0ABS4U482_9PSEU|nr:hypothetical protein [Kibdelosporangium banguiense]MBP2331014.1 hypothetical protein [Kibdelosporangium banguiense]